MVHHATVGDADQHIMLMPANATSDTYIYNWTAGPNGVNVTYDATVTNGTSSFSIKDGMGTNVQVVTLSATGHGSREFPATKAGTYNVTVQFTAFKGSLMLELKPIPASTTTSSSASSSSTSTSPSSSSSGTSSSSSSHASSSTSSSSTKGSPGLGLVVLLAALGAVVAVRRRL